MGPEAYHVTTPIWLVSASYYDDSCQGECDDLTDSASATEQLLELLGWEICRGDKLKPFARARAF